MLSKWESEQVGVREVSEASSALRTNYCREKRLFSENCCVQDWEEKKKKKQISLTAKPNS